MRLKKVTIRLVASLVLTFVLGSTSLAQEPEWELVYSESEEFIRDICFVPGDDGLWQTGWGITGYPESNIIKTTDGGDTWVEIEQSYSTLLASIWFVNEDTGYICTLQGSDPAGLILKSTDGGLNWFVIRDVEDESFDKIRFKDELNGFASGYPSLYTTDGGDTWSESELPGEWDVYWQVDYAEGDIYYGVELGGEVGKTIDGGANWTLIHSFSPTMLGGIAFYDEMHGIIGGDLSTVSVTHDGGENWEVTTLGSGQRFGMAIGIFDQDIMYAGLDTEEIWMTTDGGDTWVLDTTISNHTYREMFVTPYNVAYIGGTDMSDGGGTVWRRVGDVPLVPLFDASETLTCVGSTVDFTDLSYYGVTSWDWTFEGGTPSTSTDQHPSVTYDNAGVFDVMLTVTNIDGDSETLTLTDFIEVFEIPGQPEVPTGEEMICTSKLYTYTVPEVEYAQMYTWEVSPAEAGTLSSDENEAYFTASDTWTGDFTIRVSGTNFCGDGPWSDDFNGTISLSPEVFNLLGGGSFCEGGEGVEISLDGSQEGVEYELYLEGESTGQILEGTGAAISFGLQTGGGLYESIAFNESCDVLMSEQVIVTVIPLPAPEITGLDMVCDEDVTDYETFENDGASYNWDVTGGTILEGQGTYMVTIQWGVAGTGMITVTEENDAGCEATTEPFEVFIDNCTAIDETGVSSFKIYPNPATNQLNVAFLNEAWSDGQIIIYNQLGQIVLEEKISGNSENQNVSFDISGLVNGLYLVKVLSRQGSTITSQIIKN